MKKVLLLAPMSSVHEQFNNVNLDVLIGMNCEIHIAANFECGMPEVVRNSQLFKSSCESRGIIVHQIPFYRSSLIKNLSAVKRCHNLFIKENFYMIHAHTETGGLITRLAMPKKSNTKYAYTPHGMSFYWGSSIKNWVLYYPIEKWICTKMSAVLAMNQEEFEVLNSWNKTNAKNIHGIGLKIEAIQNITVNKKAKRKELGIPEKAFLILSVGELNGNKNHEVIIKALAKISNSQIYYMLCGEGHMKDRLKELSVKFGLDKRVIFPGYRKDIPELLYISDLFVHPSYHEGLPVSLMEAMAAGLPVICSKIRGNVDLIEDGKGGFLIEPKDVSGIRNAIKKMIENAYMRQNMKIINMNNINKFSYEIVKEETKKIYYEIFQNGVV